MTNPERPASLSGPRYWLTWTFAVALSIVFIIGCLILFFAADNPGVDETLWARYVYVFGGLEAIVFTAVGWIFGREVNRSAVEQKTAESEQLRNDNKALAKEAAHGRAIADAVRSFAPSTTRLAVGEDANGDTSHMAGLKHLADSLFPPVPNP